MYKNILHEKCVENTMKLLLEFDFTVAYNMNSVTAPYVRYYCNGCSLTAVTAIQAHYATWKEISSFSDAMGQSEYHLHIIMWRHNIILHMSTQRDTGSSLRGRFPLNMTPLVN
ncbi:hypothetical protein T12_15163 [Trichinella patagoniensis]|uniref:Uncharacterized protein n=1 Tax=Trichinella patagoniensis TaxID=990121 RepID=A0A0V0ZN83_9BILA|nr:hypothetical protein T12_15163 [Trichinella patagoniensis]